jgi:hypothetical protein
MIEEPTLLVLGAGASAHCGYPLGSELIENITRQLKEDSEWYRKAIVGRDEGWKVPTPSNFLGDARLMHAALERQRPLSIDAFLASNPSFENIGKLHIAYQILKAQSPDIDEERLRKRNDGDWYRILVHQISSGCSDFSDLNNSLNKIFFLTFNYDLSLEHNVSLKLGSMQRFHGYDHKIFSIIKNNTWHVYGSIYEYNRTSNGRL